MPPEHPIKMCLKTFYDYTYARHSYLFIQMNQVKVKCKDYEAMYCM